MEPDAPDTPATRDATTLGLDHEVRVTEPAGPAAEAAQRLGVAPEALLKTLVVRRAEDDYLFVLLPGPAQLDWRKLRAKLGVSRISLPDAATALAVTGYERGTITPLGASHPWPVLAEASVAGAGVVTVGAGARGVAIIADADDLLRALDAEVVDLSSER